jgi:hypothetical protein
MIERPWFPISVQYMFRVYCVPFTSYMRFFLGQKNGDLSISAARGRARPEVTSPFESSTTCFMDRLAQLNERNP